MLILALCNAAFAETFHYKEEFNEWYNNANNAIHHKINYHPNMINLRIEVENCIKQSDNNLRPWYDLKKYENFFSRDLFSGSIQTVDSELPKLHQFVENLCKKNNIDKPFIVVPPNKNDINAAACKIFRENGVIFIFPELINSTNDEELEAVIAHEIGHIKHNHINKILAFQIPTIVCTAIAFHKLLSHCISNVDLNKLVKEKTELIGQGLKVQSSVILGILTCAILRKLIFGKKFEQQADKFAMDHGHANGLKSIMAKTNNQLSFDDTLKYIEDNKAFLSQGDYNKFIRLWQQAVNENSSAEYWDEHPTHEERIKAAEEYLNNQNLHEEPSAA